MKCPVCGKVNRSMLCPECGFDSSRDYGRYPTFGAVQNARPVSVLRKQWQYKLEKQNKSAEFISDAPKSSLIVREKVANPKNKTGIRGAKERTKFWLYRASAAAAVLAVFLGIRIAGGHKPAEVPAETLPIQSEFTDWLDELPEYVNPADYVIEEQTLYSTQLLEKTTSVQSDQLDNWTLVDTITNVGEFGPWSEWSDLEVIPTDTRNVESQTRYRYKTKETTTASSAVKDGWELYETETYWGAYGAWSSWSASQAESSDSREVQSKIQYSYRDKQYTTSSNAELSGWTRYDSEYEWSGYGNWSDWSDTPISESDSVDVETRQVLVSEAKTTYTYGAYFSSNSSKPYSWTHFCGTCAKLNYGGTWTYKTYTQSTRATVSTLGQSCGHKGSFATQYKAADGYKYYYEEVNTTDAVYKTEYRSRTRSKIYTYHFYKWGDWTGYKDSEVTKNSDREVKTRTVYRFRDRERITEWHFFRWSDWSDWTAEPLTENSSRMIETKQFYRYQDKIVEIIYCFERWSDWSEYTTEPAEETDECKVQSKTQYRFRSKTDDEKQNSDSDAQVGLPQCLAVL